MVQKKRIYYARTYRYLAFDILKNVLYFLLLIFPALILYRLNLHAITRFLSESGVKILGKVFPGISMNIVTVGYPVFGQVDYITMPAVLPEFPFIVKNLWVLLAGLVFLSTGKKKGHPVAIFFTLSLVTHVVSCVFFLFGANHFPYGMEEFSELYISQQVSIWLIFMILSGLVTGFVGSRGYLFKSLTFLGTMAYSLVFGGIRYLVFLFILERYSMLYMAVMFFVLGPLFDFMYMVWIYSFFVNKMIKLYDSGEGKEDWRWL